MNTKYRIIYDVSDNLWVDIFKHAQEDFNNLDELLYKLTNMLRQHGWFYKNIVLSKYVPPPTEGHWEKIG